MQNKKLNINDFNINDFKSISECAAYRRLYESNCYDCDFCKRAHNLPDTCNACEKRKQRDEQMSFDFYKKINKIYIHVIELHNKYDNTYRTLIDHVVIGKSLKDMILNNLNNSEVTSIYSYEYMHRYYDIQKIKQYVDWFNDDDFSNDVRLNFILQFVYQNKYGKDNGNNGKSYYEIFDVVTGEQIDPALQYDYEHCTNFDDNETLYKIIYDEIKSGNQQSTK